MCFHSQHWYKAGTRGHSCSFIFYYDNGMMLHVLLYVQHYNNNIVTQPYVKNKNVLKKDITFNEEGRREWEENFLTHLWKLHLTSGTCPDHFWCASLGRTASHMVICQHWEWSGRPDRNEDPRIPWECELNNLLKTILRPKQERII